MHRTTIMLPESLKRRASKLARREGVSLAELIRSALEERIAARTDWANDPLWKALEPMDFPPDSPTDLAANHDKYLYELLEEELQRQGRG
jgi:hypothetical protein